METSLKISANLVAKSQGFSLDLGGSLIKTVISEPTDDGITLQFRSFPTEDIDSALQYLKSRTADFPKTATVSICGISALKYLDRLETELAIKCEILLEFDCIVDGFQFLTKNYSLNDVSHQMSPYVHEYARQVSSCMYKCQDAQSTENRTRQKPWKRVTQMEKSKTVEYPLILAITGSASNVLKVDADGTYTCMDVVVASGRHLLGLGSLLTGATTYSDLISAAERGASGAVHVLGRHLKLPGQGDIYSDYPDHNTVFGYGHAVGKTIGDFSQEDLAASHVSSVVQGLAGTFHHWSMAVPVRQVFVCGGLTDSRYARDELGKYLECRAEGNALGMSMDYFFIKFGVYLGALGGLLRNLDVSETR